MMNRRRAGVGCSVLLVAAVVCGLPQSIASAQTGRATVRLEGRAVLQVSAGNGRDAAVRARVVEERLQLIAAAPGDVSAARVAPSSDGASRVITVLSVPVVTVTPEDAVQSLTDVDALAKSWATSIDAALTAARTSSRSGAGRFGNEVLGSIRAAFGRVLESAVDIVPRALAALVVLLVFWSLARLIRWGMRRVFRRFIKDLTVENLLKQLAYYAVWALGVIVALDALGLERQNVIAGLGLSTLVLGFALKDILSNFVSGVLLLLLRPFRIGDQIVVGDTEGTVKRVELRATEIHTYDGRLVLVPNAEVFTSRVTNNTASPIRRSSVRLYLGYDVALKDALPVLREAVQRAEGVLEAPAVTVRIPELTPEDVVVDLLFWADSRRFDFVETTSRARAAALDAARAQGIGLPEPDLRILRIAETQQR